MPLGAVHPSERERKVIQAAPFLTFENHRSLSLAERVERALRANGYPGLSAIEVSVQGGRVVLKGRVPTYYMKQMAQVIATAVAGVQELCNDVELIPPAALAPIGRDGRSVVFSQGGTGGCVVIPGDMT